jgi:hypothetical protein
MIAGSIFSGDRWFESTSRSDLILDREKGGLNPPAGSHWIWRLAGGDGKWIYSKHHSQVLLGVLKKELFTVSVSLYNVFLEIRAHGAKRLKKTYLDSRISNYALLMDSFIWVNINEKKTESRCHLKGINNWAENRPFYDSWRRLKKEKTHHL